MELNVWSYLKEYEAEKEEIHQAIERVLNSGVLILGENVRKFESEFSAYCSVKYGVGVNSATDAIFLGLKALNVGPNDEVITVSNTAVPTVSAIAATGATARFVDIDPETYLMDVSQLEKAITSKTKCIIPVHLFGQCVDMDLLHNIVSAQKNKISVLEDCAQCHGAKYKGRMSGSMSDVSAFSFYPTKILGGYGDGGMVLTNNEDVLSSLKKLRAYGMETTYYSVQEGYNSRLDEIHAAILLSKFKNINQYIGKRRELASRYYKLLKDTSLILPHEGKDNFHAYYLYVVRHKRRDEIMAQLKENNIVVNISYPWPIHTMSGFKYLGYNEGDLPHTEAAAKEIFSLPMYPSLTFEEQDYVIDTLKNILTKI